MEAADSIEAKFLNRVGFSPAGTGVILMKLSDQKASSDPYEWGGRTMPPVHNWIIENFDAIENGQVIDTRVLLGETLTAATPEIAA